MDRCVVPGECSSTITQLPAEHVTEDLTVFANFALHRNVDGHILRLLNWELFSRTLWFPSRMLSAPSVFISGLDFLTLNYRLALICRASCSQTICIRRNLSQFSSFKIRHTTFLEFIKFVVLLITRLWYCEWSVGQGQIVKIFQGAMHGPIQRRFLTDQIIIMWFFIIYSESSGIVFNIVRKTYFPASRWKYQFLYDHWSQASWAQPVFRWITLSEEWWVLLQGNQGVKPKWLLRKTGNSASEADHRIPPKKQQKKKQIWFRQQMCTSFTLRPKMCEQFFHCFGGKCQSGYLVTLQQQN